MINYILKSHNPLDKTRFYNIQFSSKLIAWSIALVLSIDLILHLLGIHCAYSFFQTDYNEVISNLIGVLTTIAVSSFTLIIVALQIASAQFSPRIIRHFYATDSKVQGFLGLYIGSIIICFITKSIGIADAEFNTAIGICLILGLICLMAFPLFITYYVENINASSITESIKNRIVKEINTIYKTEWTVDSDTMNFYMPIPKDTNEVIKIRYDGKSGYLDEINKNQLLSTYKAFKIKYPDIPVSHLIIKVMVGEFIAENTTELAKIVFAKSLSMDQKKQVLDYFNAELPQAMLITKYRSYEQDINFGIRQLIDIAIKAISPAINDPTTCINCVDYLGVIIQKLSDRKFPSSSTEDLYQHHIYCYEANYEGIIDFAFVQIFHFGKEDPIIIKRILRTLSNILPTVNNPYVLHILIKEVNEMEIPGLLKKYRASLLFTTENEANINHELRRFERKAKIKIQELETNHVLSIFQQKSMQLKYDQHIQSELQIIEKLRQFNTILHYDQ